MLVQALADYADSRLADQLTNEAWETKPVPYLLAIDAAGTFLNLIVRSEQVTRGKKTVSMPMRLSVPRSPVPRNAGLFPLLAADDIKYVLGIGPWTAKEQEANNRERHEAFAALIRQATNDTRDEALQAAVAFYARPDQVEAARAALGQAKPGTLVALALGNEPIVDRSAVKTYWSTLYADAATERVADSVRGECLISGKFGPIAPTHEKIKGLASLGGQSSGVSLMSFDKEAFRSYGWEQNANSPVSPGRAMAYTLALNDLLKVGGKHRRDIASVGFIFWTKHATELTPWSAIFDPLLSNVVMYFIILTTAATLNAHGVKNIETAKQASEALRPLAGRGAYWLFTLGLIGTGVLAVPVLAGSCAYAIAEGARWRSASLNKKPHLAKRFYGVIAVAVLVGLALDFAGFDAVKMLFWSAVLNGVLAPPLVVLVVLLTGDRKVMGKRVNSRGAQALGWVCAAVMSLAAAALLIERLPHFL